MNLALILLIVATCLSQLFGATAADTSLLPSNTHVYNYKTNYRGLGATPINLNQDAVLLPGCCSDNTVDNREIAKAEGGATTAVAATAGQSYFPVFSINTPFILVPFMTMMMGIFFDGKNPMVSGAVLVTTLSGQLSKNRVAAAGCPANCKKDGACKDSSYGYCCSKNGGNDNPCEDSGWFQDNECEIEEGQGTTYVGCGSCVGTNACKEMKNRNVGVRSCVGPDANHDVCTSASNCVIGDYSCYGHFSCNGASESTIGDYSCRGEESWQVGNFACFSINEVTVGSNACLGPDACKEFSNGSIGDFSCTDNNACHGEHSVPSPCEDINSCAGKPKGVDSSTIGIHSCVGGYSCYDQDYSIIGDISCQGEYACIAQKSNHATWFEKYYCPSVTYPVGHNNIGHNSCLGSHACACINFVTVESGACVGDNSCRDLQSTTVPNRRMLTTEEEKDLAHTTMVIPANTCVGDGSCENCQYLLETFPGRCNNETSPSDVSTEQHGNVCKLCRPLGSDDFEIDLPTGGDCEWVQGHIARALENLFIRKAIKEYSQELGHLQYELKDDGEDGTCRVTIHYNPNPSDEDDADVLARIKTYVREIVKNEELMDILQDEFPNIYDRISRIRIKDVGDDGDSAQRSKSKKAKEPKEPKRAKRNKSAKEKRNMDIFE